MNSLRECDRQKFEELYNKYCRFMKYIALKHFGNDTLAEDAVHNAFIKLLNYLDKIEEIDCPKTRNLAAVVIENECKDLIKKEKRHKLRYLKFSGDNLTVKGEKADISFTETVELSERLNELDEKYRTVLMMKIYYDLSDNEIAELLNISGNNVRKRLQRARTQIFKISKEKEM